MVKCCKFGAGGRGQSFIEVMVAVGTVSLLLVALLAIVTLSLKNTRMAKSRTQAVSLAQEGVELMRAYRDYDWETMRVLANGSNYNLPANWVVATGLSQACALDPEIYSLFWRCVELNPLTATSLEAIITVGWAEGGRDFSTVQATRLSLWER